MAGRQGESGDNTLEEGWPGRKTRVREGKEGGCGADGRIQGPHGCCGKGWAVYLLMGHTAVEWTAGAEAEPREGGVGASPGGGRAGQGRHQGCPARESGPSPEVCDRKPWGVQRQED